MMRGPLSASCLKSLNGARWWSRLMACHSRVCGLLACFVISTSKMYVIRGCRGPRALAPVRSNREQQELALPGTDHALEVFVFSTLDRHVTTHEFVAQVFFRRLAGLHPLQRVLDGDRQTQIAPLIPPALDGCAGFKL